MHGRDSAGRQVSLLNDGESPLSRPRLLYRSYRSVGSHASYASISSSRSGSSSPMTPELVRSDSYDSRTSNDPTSPLTPATLSYEHAAHAQSFHRSAVTPYDDCPDPDPLVPQRPLFVDLKYDDDARASPVLSTSLPEPLGKRYPCRYRDTHGCDKTFTTSGHASRHSKIHTAEKAVQCTHPNCAKKFTRADNMKQHLETHYKDRSRSSVSQRSLSSKSPSSTGCGSSSLRRASLASGARTASSASISTVATAEWDMDPCHAPTMSPSADSRVVPADAAGRPAASRMPSGLDALAFAIACQERGEA